MTDKFRVDKVLEELKEENILLKKQNTLLTEQIDLRKQGDESAKFIVEETIRFSEGKVKEAFELANKYKSALRELLK